MLCLALCAAGCSADVLRPRPVEKKLLSLAAKLVEDHDLPGITMAVATADGVVSVAAGAANTESGSVMSPETTMLAASIGKTFVAATMLQLVDEGRLELDAPISNWLADESWFDRIPNAQEITVRHLLNHSSGLPDHVHMQAFRDLWLAGDAAD
jgi:D-alanyl-D-alanine carboxypeptidase